MIQTAPIIFLVYRRPDLTEQSFAAIRDAEPRRLLVVADGPKNQEEALLTDETRRVIREGVDWDCDVSWNVAEENMGLANRVSSGISWAFDDVDRAIILEDDCIAHPDFFRFCSELLTQYESNPEVMAITGDNYQGGKKRGRASYYFSIFPHCWGWATWKRAWNHYDHSLQNWPETQKFIDSLDDDSFRDFWLDARRDLDEGKVDSWAYRWVFSMWAARGLAATPNANLVENIGFGEDATHAIETPSWVPAKCSLKWPLEHPRRVRRNANADRYVCQNVFRI